MPTIIFTTQIAEITDAYTAVNTGKITTTALLKEMRGRDREWVTQSNDIRANLAYKVKAGEKYMITVYQEGCDIGSSILIGDYDLEITQLELKKLFELEVIS